jgi:Ca2+/Na+ antiporter
MFSGIKAYAAGIGLVVVLAVLGYLLYTYDSTQKKNTALEKEVTTTKIENKDLKETVDLTKKASDITTETVTHHAKESKKVDQTFDGIDKRADDKIAVIKRQPPPVAQPGQPAASAASPSFPTPQEAQISEVRIDALWESYCAAAPAAEQCKPAEKK